MTQVDLSLRQAILLNDIALVERILKNNPSYLHNPDFADKSNTSLHLAAQHGREEIAVCAHRKTCLLQTTKLGRRSI
jgi:uncharacterized protein